MARFPVPGTRQSTSFFGTRTAICAATFVLGSLGAALPQSLDCNALRARIATLDAQPAARANPSAAAARKQQAEIDRTASYARSLGCDQPEIPFFGPPLNPRCRGLNAKIAQMQANLGQLQAAAASGTDRTRQELMARYDASCRAPIQARQQPGIENFFETLFGAFAPSQPPAQQQVPWAPPLDESPDVEPDTAPRGGSQAVCVRTCDGGFFPLHVSARRAEPSYLGDLCRALCPNAEVSVFTRAPNSDIERAVSLDDGTVYADLPNALKFRSSYDSSCSCRPAGQSWVEALAGAEQLLGEGRSGDILVTPEKSAQLSQARSEPKLRAKVSAGPSGGQTRPPVAAQDQAAAATPAPGREEEVVGPDGVKRRVRIIGPTP